MNSADMTSPSTAESPLAAGSKRKTDDGRPQQQRAKRARYISIACNECKRRKIKCNGQTPCQRCGNLGLECLYAPNCCNNLKDSEEFREMMSHISSLQQQVDTLYSNLSALKSQIDPSLVQVGSSPYPPPQYDRTLPIPPSQVGTAPMEPPLQQKKPTLPRYHGPTSSAFSIGVAKSSLRTLGITGPDDGLEDGSATQEGTPAPSPPPPPPALLPVQQVVLHATKDPIWGVSKEEADRLLSVFEEHVIYMYPVVDTEAMRRHISMLWVFMDAARRTGLMQGGAPGADAIDDPQTRMLKLILAVATVVEGSGKSERGRALFESVRHTLEEQLFNPPDIKLIRMLSLAAMYYFHLDEESNAWRLTGFAARLSMELGLHRRETYNKVFATDEERSSAILLFWAIRVLDQRWSFGTGMPFAMQDADVDPLLQKPGDLHPYLSAMVAYTGIATRVWQRVTVFDVTQSKLSSEEIDNLDYQVVSWHSSLPEPLKYNPHNRFDQPNDSSPTHRIRIVLYLRANQMRMNIHRPVLHSATSIAADIRHAHNAVDIAKDTIHILTSLNQTTDIYKRQQVMFNYFLLTALAALFLSVSHAPDIFAPRCRDEYYMSLDLVRSMTPNSLIAKRLWRTIRGLKEVGPKLGLRISGAPVPTPAPHPNAHSAAAVAMAGLAGHNVDEMAAFANAPMPVASPIQQQPGMPMGDDDPNGMADDLTNLFEAVGGYFMPNGGFPPQAQPNGGPGPAEGMPNAPANGQHQDELNRILRDLF